MSAFKKLNYQRLRERNAVVYDTIVNTYGQTIDFVEHPSHGDSHPVIAMFPEFEIAADTGFYDLGDFYEGSEYIPVYDVRDGEVYCAWELED